MEKVIYVAELDQDIDDLIAVEYLNTLGFLREIVLDPKPTTKEGLDRVNMLENKGIKVSDKIPQDAKVVFVGGALTSVANFLRFNGKLDLLVMNGGFVGSNIVSPEDQLDKFKNKVYVRTFNFNVDAFSTNEVLRASEDKIKQIVLVGKNVCHSIKNTKIGIWKNNFVKDILDKYHVKDEKRQHDVLACHEGLIFAQLLKEPLMCQYADVYPITKDGLQGNMTQWGSTKNPKSTIYRKVTSAYRFK